MSIGTTPAIVTLDDWVASGGWYEIARNKPPSIDGSRDGGWEASLDVYVYAFDLMDFCQFCGGVPRTYTVGGVTVTRLVPLSHPAAPRLLCSDIKSEYIGEFTPSNDPWIQQWSHAKVSLKFKAVPYATDGSQPFMVINTRGGVEEYSLAGVRLQTAGGIPLQTDASLPVHTTIYSITIFQCPALGDNVVIPLQGKVNTGPMLMGSMMCAAGCVKFMDMQSEDSMTPDFQIKYTRTLSFGVRDVDWRMVLLPDGTWDFAVKPGGGYILDDTDLSVLLQ